MRNSCPNLFGMRVLDFRPLVLSPTNAFVDWNTPSFLLLWHQTGYCRHINCVIIEQNHIIVHWPPLPSKNGSNVQCTHTHRLACRVIVEPTTGTAACGVSATMLAGIWPAACIALYCSGVMCSKPGGGTSQYNEGLRLRDRNLRPPERDRLRRRSRDLERPPRPRLRLRSRDRFRRVLPRSPTPPRRSLSTN